MTRSTSDFPVSNPNWNHFDANHGRNRSVVHGTIGTGKTATPEIAQEVHGHIRGRLVDRFGDAGRGIRIQYGGSVKPDNVDELMAQADIDGALVGGASLDPEAFARIACFVPAGGTS